MTHPDAKLLKALDIGIKEKIPEDEANLLRFCLSHRDWKNASDDLLREFVHFLAPVCVDD